MGFFLIEPMGEDFLCVAMQKNGPADRSNGFCPLQDTGNYSGLRSTTITTISSANSDTSDAKLVLRYKKIQLHQVFECLAKVSE